MKRSIICSIIIYSLVMVILPVDVINDYIIAKKVFFALLAISLIAYHLRSNKKDMLVTASISDSKSFEEKNKQEKPNLSFRDVAGLEEVKEELSEIVSFFNDYEKFHKMGAKIPGGVLFHGPPGTGKTLLAKSVAGEAKSNFIYASGSEFVEKYVGIGAKRVRSLFERAKKDSPTIIFIDEIDAIGTRRNSDNNNEKDQTLNQLLIEMDGFGKDENVVVIGATNRLDLLDEALLRPGRFDRHIYVGNPNSHSREKIFDIHTKDKPLDTKVDTNDLACKTHGFSSAQIANIVNEAAIIAVRNNKRKIDVEDFNSAIERVVAGLELKHPSVLDKEKEIVAFHEAGHAVVGKLLNSDVIQKVSIVPRGQALGYVLKLADEERYLLSKNDLINKIKVFLAGRITEQVIFDEITTGAADDLKKATDIAHKMVCDYGMSNLGSKSINAEHMKYNSKEVDLEINKIINSSFNETLDLIKRNRDLITYIAKYLIEKETMTGHELDTLILRFNKEQITDKVI